MICARPGCGVEFPYRSNKRFCSQECRWIDARDHATIEARTHGIRATYLVGCRCPPCTTANSEYKRRERGGRTMEQYRAEVSTPWRVKGRVIGPGAPFEGVTIADFCKDRGYDPTTKSYQEAV